jgi:hypothetical protein
MITNGQTRLRVYQGNLRGKQVFVACSNKHELAKILKTEVSNTVYFTEVTDPETVRRIKKTPRDVVYIPQESAKNEEI